LKRNTEAMYATMNPWKLFFIVALPGMISMFAMSIYSIIEGAFIGQTLGENAFAAINIAFPLVMINFSLADLIGVGASVPISIALGKQDYKTANNVFSCSVVMIFVTSVIMGSIMFLAAEPLSAMMGAEGKLLETSVRYLRTCALCSPLTSIFFAMDNYLRISGFVKTSMIINVCSNFATIGLLAVFLFVLDMDVVGSALATSISMCLCSVVAMIPFLAKKTLLRFTKPHFNFAMIKEISACGSPIFLNNISGRVTSILMNITLISMGDAYLGEGGGTTAVAVYAVLMYSSDLCWPLLYGISDSLAPSIGYNWGAENYDRVKKIAKCNYIGTMAVGLVSTSVLFFGAPQLAALFSNADEAKLLALSAHGIKLFCFAYLFRWVTVSTQSLLSAIEKPARATIMSVCMALVFPVLLLFALRPLGLDGIWVNFVGVNILGVLLGVVLLLGVIKEIRKKEKTRKDNRNENQNQAVI